MAKANAGDTVRVHYKGKLNDGSEFDSSEGRDPLEFTLGEGQVIPGFEAMINGMEVGEKRTETIPADQAYGQHDDRLILEVEKERLPDELEPTVGDMLQVQQPNGQAAQVKVIEIGEEAVKLDGNHPLAGEDLVFDVELVDIV